MTLTTIIVTGRYKDMLDHPAAGSVIFDPDAAIFTDSATNTIYTKQTYTARLNASGEFSIVIPCTDVSALDPTSFTYTIEEDVTGLFKRRRKGIAIPSTLGLTVDITELPMS